MPHFHSYRVYNGQKRLLCRRAGLGMAKKVCEDWANLLMNERVRIRAAGEREQRFLDRVFAENRFPQAANRLQELKAALGTGAYVPRVTGGKIRIDCLDAEHIFPLSWENGEIRECAFAAGRCAAGHDYLYLQLHRTEGGLYEVENLLYLADGGRLEPLPLSALEELESKKRSNVFFTFPETKEGCTTSLVLKVPKTETSVRDVYIPNSVAQALLELRAEQERQKEKLHGLYQDFDMVIAQPDGRPTEERLIAKDLKKLIAANNIPPVVFHSLRHLSTSLKLQYSEGDIKAVQGDTGHAQASMVTQVYSHTFDENRRRVANRMENSFFHPQQKQQLPMDKKS